MIFPAAESGILRGREAFPSGWIGNRFRSVIGVCNRNRWIRNRETHPPDGRNKKLNSTPGVETEHLP
jgi:hypothetical protein